MLGRWSALAGETDVRAREGPGGGGGAVGGVLAFGFDCRRRGSMEKIDLEVVRRGAEGIERGVVAVDRVVRDFVEVAVDVARVRGGEEPEAVGAGAGSADGDHAFRGIDFVVDQ